MIDLPTKKTMNIQVRVTRDQYGRIKNNAEAKGYTTVAQFMRYLALDKDMLFERKFNELYNQLMRTNNNKKGKKKKYLIQEEFLI